MSETKSGGHKPNLAVVGVGYHVASAREYAEKAEWHLDQARECMRVAEPQLVADKRIKYRLMEGAEIKALLRNTQASLQEPALLHQKLRAFSQYRLGYREFTVRDFVKWRKATGYKGPGAGGR